VAVSVFETIFAIGNPLALVGWAGLILFPGRKLVVDRVSGLIIPALFAIAYAGLVGAFGTGAGIAIAANTGHWVAAAHTDVGGFPIFGWTRTGGDLRVGHFFGIHAMQILPLLGLLVGADRRHGRAIVWIGGRWPARVFTVATTVQARFGQPFLG
jgi:hypothetical protein